MPGKLCEPLVSQMQSAWLDNGSPSPRCRAPPSRPEQATFWPQRGRSLDPPCKPEMFGGAERVLKRTISSPDTLKYCMTVFTAWAEICQWAAELWWAFTVPLHQYHPLAWTLHRCRIQSFERCFLENKHCCDYRSAAEKHRETNAVSHKNAVVCLLLCWQQQSCSMHIIGVSMRVLKSHLSVNKPNHLTRSHRGKAVFV